MPASVSASRCDRSLSPWPGSPSPSMACTSRPPGRRCPGDRGEGAVVGGTRALRGRHRHRDPLPAQDRLEDVLRVFQHVRGRGANTHVCPVCLALPGVLPVINRRAVEFVIATGLAIGAEIPERTQWERKNYFYPDLPKGYQISQYAIPLAARGRLAIETSAGPFTVPITRAHLEEDTAKLVHDDAARAGSG